MKQNTLLLLACFLTISLFSQVEDYDWNDTMDYTIDENEYQDYSAIVLLDYRIQEFMGNTIPEMNRASMHHKIIKILDEKAIEDYNRVYIDDVENLIELKARTIKPDGTIIEVKEEYIKKINDEDFDLITIFAIEGVEEGDVLEYMYKMKNMSNLFGIEIFQTDIPVKKAIFEIVQTSLYEVFIKSYNGLDTFSLAEDSPSAISISKDIPALPNEYYSANNQNRMCAGYSVKYLSRGWIKEEVISWEKIVKAHAWASEVIRIKGTKKFFSELGFDEDLSDLEKVIRLEKHFKENFTYKNRSAEESGFKNILKNKYGNDIDLTRAMKYLLELQNIDAIWLLSTDRLDVSIDPNFPNPHSLSEHVLFIPSLGKFVSMGYPNMRIGAPPAAVLDNFALIIDNHTHTDPVGKIQFDAINFTRMNNQMDVSISSEFDNVTVKKKNKYTGYMAFEMREFIKEIGEEEIEAVIQEYEASSLGEVDLKSLSIKNEDFNLAVKNTPLEMDVEFDAKELIEDAGGTYILNIGRLIGEMMELYEEETRHTPIEIEYPYVYISKIKLQIPEGYTVTGLEDFVNQTYYFNDLKEKIAGFESIVKKKDNQIQFTIYEYYLSLLYRKEKYDDFRKVINAGADFNKLVLVLEKVED